MALRLAGVFYSWRDGGHFFANSTNILELFIGTQGQFLLCTTFVKTFLSKSPLYLGKYSEHSKHGAWTYMPLLFALHFINKRMDSIFQIQQRPNFCPIFDENSCAHHCSSIFHLVTEAISLPISTVRSDFLKETFTSRLMMKGSMNTQPKLCIIKTFQRKGNIITFQIQNNISQDIWKKLFLSLRKNDFCHQILF